MLHASGSIGPVTQFLSHLISPSTSDQMLAHTLRRASPARLGGCTRRALATSNPQFQTAKSRRQLSTTSAIALVTLSSVAFYALGSILPPQSVQYLFPRPVEAAPQTPEYIQQLEDELDQLPALKEMRQAADADDWYETRPYAPELMPPETVMHNLTAGALRAPGKLAIPPLARVKWDESEAVIFVHIGRGLCGWPGVVHGGMLATVFDEAMGRMAVRNGGEVNTKEKGGAGVMVTKSLEVRYKRPTAADQWVMVRTKLAKKTDEGGRRRVTVEGILSDMEGKRLVEATCVMYSLPICYYMLIKSPQGSFLSTTIREDCEHERHQKGYGSAKVLFMILSRLSSNRNPVLRIHA